MTCLFKRVLPFTLTLILGVMSWHLLRDSLDSQSKQGNDLQSNQAQTTHKPFYYDASGLRILSLPDFDFTPEARETDGLSGTAHFVALFEKDGTLGTINPAVIIPYGMTYKQYVAENHEEPSFARLNGKAVENLPYGMTEALRASIEKIKFTPAMTNGEPHFVWLDILIEFNLIISPDCIECSSIIVTISDIYGTIMRKSEIWLRNAYGRTSIVRKHRH